MKEELLKQKKYIEECIEMEKKFNQNNGTISCLEYQLWCVNEKLKEINDENNN